MKRISLLMMVIVTIMMMWSCGTPKNADEKMANQTKQLMSEANRQIGMPAIKNFQERKQMKMILEARDQEHLICYAYLYDRNHGTVGQFLGKCIGYGLPYSVQYTNPDKIVYNYGEHHIMPQADPNGLFMPTGLSATWLFLLDSLGEPHPVYVEPEIIVSPFKLKK